MNAISCRHGQLARGCNICEMERGIERLRAEIAIEHKRQASMRTLIASQEAIMSHYRSKQDEADEAIRTLDSERAANATLTAELAACRSALAKVGPYYVPATSVSDEEAEEVYAAIDAARKGEGE